MPSLVLDANVALHAKQVGGAEAGPLNFLELLAARGVRLLTTRAVEAEQRQMTLSDRLDAWLQRGWFESSSTSVRERREIRNQHRGKHNWPGDNDIGLIALAHGRAAVLLSHDGNATRLGRECRVITVDVFDLADLAVELDWAAWPEIEKDFEGFRDYAWKPDDWAGSVRATVETRPSRERLKHRLRDWLASE